MQELVSTSQVKRMLVDCGAVRPTKRAVAMVASEEGVSPDHPGQETRYWSLRFPVETIADAVQRCVDDAGKPLRGEASYSAFAAALKEVRH